MALKAATPREDGGLGAVFHRLAEADFGVDGHLQILNQPTREATGRLVGIQIKAGPSYFRESVRDGWIVRIPRSTVAYWRDYSVPVLLVLVDTETDTGYWARVSDTDFVLAGDSYKIHVPQTQKFDASSAAAVEAIAAKAPASLASRIELHSRLASEEPTVRKALDDARTPQELTAAADRAVAFAGALQRAGRPYDAAFVWRRGVQAYFKAEQPERGLVSLTGLVAWLVHDLREAEFALTIHRDALAAERPFGKGGPGVGVPGRLQLDLDLLMADTEAICGSSASAEKLASRLETLADQATASEATWLTMAALKCRVAAAIAREDHAGAGRAYADLAPTLPEEEQASAVLRSRLHLGLAGEGAEQLQILSDYPVEGSALIERSLVRGWLRDSLGDFAGARSEFIEAADAAVAADEPYKALRALRNAERCERRAPLLHIGLDSVWQRAQRLEGIVAGRSGDQMTHTRLIRRIESRLGRDGLREAYFTVRAGAFYSWDDIDPAAYEDILVRYASLMRAAAADAPSTELILQAVRATADVCALLDHREAESALAPFLDVLRERLTPEFAERVWREIEESTQTPSGVTGGLMLAIDLADKWRFADRDARLGALLRRGLAVGFGGRGEDGSASKAIDLILKLSPALEGAEAGAVRDQVTSMLAVAPGHSLNDYLNAVARTTAHAPPPEDGGQSLFDILLRCERQAAEHGASPQWLGALAMLHREASGAPKERLASLLRDRASTAKGASAAGWHAAERALAGGIELPDELADRYLKEMTDLLGALRAQTRKTGLGGGASDVIPLTRWAATKASPAVRERALRAGIEFLGYPEHLLYERVRWIPFIAHLARSSPSMIPEATEALLLAAKGGLTPAGDFDAFTNPFAFFRVTGHTDEGIRSSAIHGLATFMPAADQAGRQIIVDALRSAVGAVEPEVRLAAAIGAGWAVRELLHCPEAVITLEQVVLRPLAGDPVARIALAAYKGLLEGRFTEPTQM